MGGELEIVTRFADHTVKIRNFADLNEKERVLKKAGHEADSEDAPAGYWRKTGTG
jgi:hypothetical protein